MSFFVVVMVGVLGGLAGAMQSQFLGVMEQRVGTLASAFVTFGGGGLAIAILLIALRGGLGDLKDLPWWCSPPV